MKPVGVKSKTDTEFIKDINNINPKFKIGDIAKISKYKNISANACTPDWSEEDFSIKNAKNPVQWRYIISDPKGEKLLECFMNKNLKKIKINVKSRKEKRWWIIY